MISNETSRSPVYTGNGTVATFAFAFRILSDEDIEVLKINTATAEVTILTLDTDYTVTGVRDEDGSITLTAGNLATGYQLVIVLKPAILQQSDLLNQGGYFPELVEDSLDNLANVVKAQQDQINRSLSITSAASFDGIVGAPFPGYVLAVNSTGDGLVWTSPGSTTLSTPADGSVTLPKLDSGFILPEAKGGTNASTFAAARTNLGLGTAAVLDVGTTASKVVQLTAAAKYPAVDGSLITNIPGQLSANTVVLLQDQKASGTAGGTFTNGAWRTRVLNTEVADSGGLCALGSNQFTLTAGTYLIEAIASTSQVQTNRLRLQNVTDATTVLQGNNSQSGTGSDEGGEAELIGVFTIAAAKALELQHYCETTKATDGFGQALTTGAVEIFSTVRLTKIG
jgi:hypothetical protein